ncbi:MAG: SDR family NAD(P)-dependent oxidoreductase [Chloroflexota bacterium]
MKQNILLTGGHSGLGLELTKKLLNEGHHLGLILRNEKRKADAIEAIGTSDNIDFFLADLAKQRDIRQVAKEIMSKWDVVDGLFSNAGVLLEQAFYSDQGNEMHFEVNTLAPYILSSELMPAFEKAQQPFIVVTASGTAREVNNWIPDIPDLKKPAKFVKLTGSYRQSKLALVLLMTHMAEENKNVRIISLNPGAIDTKMVRGKGTPFFVKLLRPFVFEAPEKGAQRVYDVAFADKYQTHTGVFVSSKGEIQRIENKLRLQDLDQINASIIE